MLISSCKNKKRKSPVSDLSQTTIKILSNKHRYAIMKRLFDSTRDMCVHELSQAVGISQSATSHQLAYLEACGVVESVRTGKTKCYLPTDSLLTKKVSRVIESLK